MTDDERQRAVRIADELARRGCLARVEDAPAWGATIVTVAGPDGATRSATSFDVPATLRALAADLGVALPPDETVAAHDRLTILLAVAVPLRRALEVALGHAGHLVFSAETPESAAAIAGSFRIDAVVCELALPRGGAVALLANWPADAAPVPAVALCHRDADDALRRACVEAGFDAVVDLPATVETLMAAIRRAARARGG